MHGEATQTAHGPAASFAVHCTGRQGSLRAIGFGAQRAAASIAGTATIHGEDLYLLF